MGRSVSRICMKCALLPIEEAKAQSCWDATICHRRRSHYRNRQQNNEKRQQERRLVSKAIPASNSDQLIEVTLPEPETLAAFLVFVRHSSGSPVHAIGAEVWQQGRLAGRIQLQHTVGMRGPDLNAYLQHMQQKLQEAFGVERFEDTVIELQPEDCPIQPCPLRPAPATHSAELR
jgi:hypothetical protein